MHKISVLLVIIAGTLWGTSGFFATNLREYGFDALQMALMRNMISAICLVPYCLFCKRDKMRVSPRHLLLFALSGLGLYGTGAFYYAAMKAASISVAVVLMYLAPIIVMTYSVIFMGETFTYKKLVCILGALVGTALVTGIIGGLRASLAGIGLGVMSGISYSLYNICVKLEMKRGDDPVVAAAFCFAFAAVIALVFGKPIDTISKISAGMPVSLVWVISIGLMTSVTPYVVYTFAMKRIPASVATAISSVEPLVATVIGVVLYKEPINMASYIGIALIVASVVFLSFSNKE